MKKLVVLFVLGLIPGFAFAQDLYQVAELSATDLNGTARYVGMGGAMGALGGDLSVMSDNPAAMGLYRRNDMAVTGSIVCMPGSKKVIDNKPTYASFDQGGFVYVMPVQSNSVRFLNFGFNYHKHHDFNQLLGADNNLAAVGHASQSWQLADLCNYWDGVDYSTPLAMMAYDAYVLGYDDENGYTAYNADESHYVKESYGANHGFDFNFAVNLKDQYYLGLTATVYSVKQRSDMYYSENILNADGDFDGVYVMGNENKLTGTGFDLKLGFVLRPVQESNFKIGLTLSTPTYYQLTYRKDLMVGSNTISYGEKIPAPFYLDRDYNIRTPWKVGVSVGNTFFNRLAVGAAYEFADYGSCSVSYDDDYWDDWDWDWRSTTKDRELNHQLSKYLKGTHTLKVGAELMVCPNLFLRGGYNYVSSAYDKDAWLNHFINSASVDVATNTDYLNLSGLNRYTAGLGLKFGNFYADATWLYQHQSGNLYTFNTGEPNDCPANKKSFNKSQVMLTMGYRF